MGKRNSLRAITPLTGIFVGLLLASTSAFAASTAASGEAPKPCTQDAKSAQSGADSCSGTVRRPLPSATANKAPASTTRVYLDDYQRVHKPVTKPYNTKAIWLGHRKRPD